MVHGSEEREGSDKEVKSEEHHAEQYFIEVLVVLHVAVGPIVEVYGMHLQLLV